MLCAGGTWKAGKEPSPLDWASGICWRRETGPGTRPPGAWSFALQSGGRGGLALRFGDSLDGRGSRDATCESVRVGWRTAEGSRAGGEMLSPGAGIGARENQRPPNGQRWAEVYLGGVWQLLITPRYVNHSQRGIMKTLFLFHKRHMLPIVAEYELLHRNLAFFPQTVFF